MCFYLQAKISTHPLEHSEPIIVFLLNSFRSEKFGKDLIYLVACAFDFPWNFVELYLVWLYAVWFVTQKQFLYHCSSFFFVALKRRSRSEIKKSSESPLLSPQVFWASKRDKSCVCSFQWFGNTDFLITLKYNPTHFQRGYYIKWFLLKMFTILWILRTFLQLLKCIIFLLWKFVKCYFSF